MWQFGRISHERLCEGERLSEPSFTVPFADGPQRRLSSGKGQEIVFFLGRSLSLAGWMLAFQVQSTTQHNTTQLLNLSSRPTELFNAAT